MWLGQMSTDLEQPLFCVNFFLLNHDTGVGGLDGGAGIQLN